MSRFFKNNQPANWIKREEINGLVYHLSEAGAVKITSPDGKVLCTMSGGSASMLGDHTEGFSSFTNNIVKPYLEELYKKKNDDKIAYKAQKEAEKFAAQLEVLAKINPDLIQAVLNKKQSA